MLSGIQGLVQASMMIDGHECSKSGAEGSRGDVLLVDVPGPLLAPRMASAFTAGVADDPHAGCGTLGRDV
jgi:hypothetical protein